MKSFVIGLLLLAASALALADTPPSKALVEQFIKQSQAEQAIAAEIDGYVKQLGADAPASAKAQLEKYLNATMGWDVIKDQYAALVEKTYTTEELNAALAFMKTPAGASMTEKSRHFTQELAALIATNVQRAGKEMSSSPPVDVDATSIDDLAVVDVTEHNVAGRIYVTGAIENHGKKPISNVRIEADLFLDGKFVDQYSSYLSGAVMPGGSRYFKVSFGCQDSPPAKHDHFKINPVQGY